MAKSHAKHEEDRQGDTLRSHVVTAVAPERNGKDCADRHNNVGLDVLLPDAPQHSDDGDNHEPGEEPKLPLRLPQFQQAHHSRLIGRIRRKYKLHTHL